MTDLTPTHTAKQSEMISRAMIRAICALIIGVLALVSYATFTGRTPSATVPQGNVVKSRLIIIEAENTGAVRIFTADGELIADLSAKQGGFISSIDRSLRRQRVVADLPKSGPVLLTLDDLNRLKISDPQSGWSADLMAFGSSNIGAFAMLLDAPTKGN
tara:strand:- start:1749 stop:2225 length:477 start_codon:yes stop_codon:yes gene_type:complete